jgi:hypothetical protein
VNGTARVRTCCGLPSPSRLKLLPSRQSGACQVPLTIAATPPSVRGETAVIVYAGGSTAAICRFTSTWSSAIGVVAPIVARNTRATSSWLDGGALDRALPSHLICDGADAATRRLDRRLVAGGEGQTAG